MQKFCMLMVICLCAFGCASSPTAYNIYVLEPADVNLSQYDTVAVVPLQGELSRDAVAKINERVSSSNLCRVMDEGHIQEIAQNMGVDSDTYSSENVLSIANMTQADALIFVETEVLFDDEEISEKKLDPDFSDDPYVDRIKEIEERIEYLEETYDREVRKRKLKISNGEDEEQMRAEIKELEIVHFNKYNEYEEQLDELKSDQSEYKRGKINDVQIRYTRIGRLRINLSVSLTDARSGEMVISKQYSEKDVLYTRATNRTPDRINPSDRFSPMISTMVKSFSDVILPHYVNHSFYVENVDHPDQERGVAFFTQKSYEQAGRVFRGIYEQSNSLDAEEKAKAYYNYGLVLSLCSDIESVELGVKVLEEAYFLQAKDYYKSVLNFAKNRKGALRKLQEQTD